MITTATPATTQVTDLGVPSGDARVMKTATSTMRASAASEVMRVDFDPARRSPGGENTGSVVAVPHL